MLGLHPKNFQIKKISDKDNVFNVSSQNDVNMSFCWNKYLRLPVKLGDVHDGHSLFI